VKPSLRIEIKSEASGEVIEIARRPGDRVKTGEPLIRLQKDDEQRSVNRASQDLQSAKARLDTAKIHLALARDSELRAAQVDQLFVVELTRFARKSKAPAGKPMKRKSFSVPRASAAAQLEAALV
jgi:multidrug efflux pump subunit AcrA (membrane-fusion protein)